MSSAKQRKLPHGLRQLQGHHIGGTHFVIALHRRAIDPDIACLGRHLKAVAGGVGQEVEQELVDPQQGLAFVGYNAVMLIKLTVLLLLF